MRETPRGCGMGMTTTRAQPSSVQWAAHGSTDYRRRELQHTERSPCRPSLSLPLSLSAGSVSGRDVVSSDEWKRGRIGVPDMRRSAWQSSSLQGDLSDRLPTRGDSERRLREAAVDSGPALPSPSSPRPPLCSRRGLERSSRLPASHHPAPTTASSHLVCASALCNNRSRLLFSLPFKSAMAPKRRGAKRASSTKGGSAQKVPHPAHSPLRTPST